MQSEYNEQIAELLFWNGLAVGLPKNQNNNMNLKKIAAKNQALVENWTHPIGTPVKVKTDSGMVVDSVTESDAWLMGGHSAMIMLKGFSGGYSLDRVTVA